MKHIFLATFLILLLLSGVAYWLLPSPVENGKTVLLWLADDNDARRQQAELFNKLNPQYKLKIDAGAGDMTKVVVQCLAGVGPDLFFAYNGFDLSSYVKAGIAWDITDELKGMDIDLHRDVWPAADSTCTYDGRVYGFPSNVATDAIWYNKDLFDQQGIPYPVGPWTWDEFMMVAERLTVRDARGNTTQFGFLCNWVVGEGEGGPWQFFIRQWGGRVYTPDGTRCVLDSPENITAVQLMQDLIYKYKVMPSPSQEESMAVQGYFGWGKGGITAFSAGKAAMALGGRWWLVAMRQNPKLRLGVVESPHGPLRAYRGYGKSTIINRLSPHRKEALAFIKYMAGQEYNELINHQADSLGPMKQYCMTEKFLHDPDFPKEDYNDVWRGVMQYGTTDEISPYVNGARGNIIIGEQMDLLKNGKKTAAEALKAAADGINLEIPKTLARDPILRARYEALTRQEGRPKP